MAELEKNIDEMLDKMDRDQIKDLCYKLFQESEEKERTVNDLNNEIKKLKVSMDTIALFENLDQDPFGSDVNSENQSRLKDLENEILDLKEKLRSSKSGIVEKDSKITILSSTIDEIQHEKELALLEVDKYKKNLKNMERELDILNENNTVGSNDLKEQNDKLRETIQSLQKKELEYQAQLQSLGNGGSVSKGGSGNAEYEEKIQELLSSISEKDTQIAELVENQRELAEVFNNAEELRRRMETYESTIDMLRKESEEKNQLLEQVRKELNDFKRKSISKRNEDLSTEDVLKFAMSLESELENSVFSRMSQSISTTETLNKMDTDKVDLKTKLNEFEDQLKKQSDVIVNLNHELEKHKSNTITLPLSSMKTEQNNDDEINREGYLVKQGQIVKSWKKRFFFLHSGLLYYAKTREDRFNTIGCIPLINATCFQQSVGGKQYSFVIETKERSYFLVASNEKEMKEWISTVQKYIQTLDHSKVKPQTDLKTTE